MISDASARIAILDYYEEMQPTELPDKATDNPEGFVYRTHTPPTEESHDHERETGPAD